MRRITDVRITVYRLNYNEPVNILELALSDLLVTHKRITKIDSRNSILIVRNPSACETILPTLTNCVLFGYF